MRKIEEIVRDLTDARKNNNQEELNKYALELTEKIWIPTIDMTFQELLESYGYVEEPKKLIKRRKP